MVPSVTANFEITAKFEVVAQSTCEATLMINKDQQVSFTYKLMCNKGTAGEKNQNSSSSNGLQLVDFWIVFKCWNPFTYYLQSPSIYNWFLRIFVPVPLLSKASTLHALSPLTTV